MPIVLATWGIAALTTLGVVLRPWRLPEYLWAVAGAALLLLFATAGTARVFAAGQKDYRPPAGPTPRTASGKILRRELAERERTKAATTANT